MINYKTEFIKLRYSGFICYSCMPVILESLACYLLLFKVLLNFSLVSYQTKNRYIRKFVPPTIYRSGEPGLVDRVLALHAGSRGFDSHRGHMSERFFRSNRPGYPHPVSSELENSGIRVAVGDCSVTERRRWRPPYQTGKTVHVHANTHYKHNEDGRTAPGVCGNGSVPLSHSGNVVTRIGIHTHTHTQQFTVLKRSHKCCCGGRKFFLKLPNPTRLFPFYFYLLFIYL